MYQRFSSTQGGRRERAVTEVLGAILVFGLVLAVLALVQVSGIPAANEQVEFEHSQRVAGDFQSLDENVDAAGTRGSLGSTAVEAGVRYPNRLFFINPGPVGGQLTSEGSQEVQLSGFSGLDEDESSDYDLSGETFTTTSLKYEAGYNEYANAPELYYENGVLFERYGDQDVIVDSGSLVSGRRITLVTVEGDFSTQVPDELPINTVPVSAATKAVTVTTTDATITIRTQLSEETWTQILNKQTDRVKVVSCQDDDIGFKEPCNGLLDISLEDDTYDLRMAKVGLTTNDNQDPAADFDEEDARYIVAETTTSTSAVVGQTVELTAEVRDRFNNPVSGESVTFSVVPGSDGSIPSPDPEETGVDGQVSELVSTAGADADDPIIVEAVIDDATTSDGTEKVTFTINLIDGSGGGGNNDGDIDINPNINPDDGGNLVLVDVSQNSRGSGNNEVIDYVVTFENTGETSRSIEELRYSFAFNAGPSGADVPTVLDVSGAGTTEKSLRLGGAYETVDSDVATEDGTLIITLTPTEGEKAFDGFLVLTAIIDADGERESAIYFVDESISNAP